MKQQVATVLASRHRQQGAVLLVGLVMLLVVTIIGVSSMQSVTLDEKIVSNMQNATLAYHGAETALADCEADIQAGTITPYNLGSMPAKWQYSDSVWQAGNVEVVDFSGLNSTVSLSDTRLKQRARCLTEYVGDGGANVDVKEFYRKDNPSSRPVFRVTSWSGGGDVNAGGSVQVEAMLESLFICPGGCSEVNAENYVAGAN